MIRHHHHPTVILRSQCPPPPPAPQTVINKRSGRVKDVDALGRGEVWGSLQGILWVQEHRTRAYPLLQRRRDSNPFTKFPVWLPGVVGR